MIGLTCDDTGSGGLGRCAAGGHLLEHAVVDDVDAGAGLRGHQGVPDDGELVVLIGFPGLRPVRAPGDHVEAVDDDHLHVHDRAVLAFPSQ